jgi:translation initiation factor 1
VAKDLHNIAGLPPELGIDADLARSQEHLTVRMERRRYGKPVTIVAGFDTENEDLRAIAKRLKQRLGTGGTVRDDTVELQGDHTDRVGDLLREDGFDVE